MFRIAHDFGGFYLYWERQLIWGVDAGGAIIDAFSCPARRAVLTLPATVQYVNVDYGGPAILVAEELPDGPSAPLHLDENIQR